jgi:hypothetical protein
MLSRNSRHEAARSQALGEPSAPAAKLIGWKAAICYGAGRLGGPIARELSQSEPQGVEFRVIHSPEKAQARRSDLMSHGQAVRRVRLCALGGGLRPDVAEAVTE